MARIYPFRPRQVAQPPDDASHGATIAAVDHTVEIELDGPVQVIVLTPAQSVSWALALLEHALAIDPDMDYPGKPRPGTSEP